MSTRNTAPPTTPQAGAARSRRPWWQIALVIGSALAVFVLIAFVAPRITGGLPTTQTDCAKAANPTSSGAVTEYCLPTATQPLHAMTVGPDGNLWFTDAYNGKLVRVTPQGVFTAFAVAAQPSGDPVAGIAGGTDGNLWYIAAGKLGRISPQGKTGAVALPAGVVATSLTAGPDGNLWLSESRATGSAVRKSADTIAKMTPSGQYTAYSLTSAGLVSAGGLTPGPDGNVWFVGITRSSSAIGRITSAGAVTVFPVAIPAQTTAPGYPACEPVDIGPCLAGSNIGGLVAGGDGNLWFIDGQGRIGRMTPSGATTFFQASELEGLSGPLAIGRGPDGAIWFAYGTPSQGTGVIKRITADGAVKSFALPHGGGISNIIAGPDGSVRFLLTAGGGYEPLSTQRLVRITP